MSTAIQTPTSRRRLLDHKISQLHKCSNLNHLKQIQAQIFKFNLHQDPFVAPKLVAAYSLCRQMTLAVNVFNLIQEPNVVLYNTLIRAYTQNSLQFQAFSTFFEMQENGVFPDNFTYPFLLKACSGQFGFQQVQMIHAHIEKFGFFTNIFVPNILIDTYSKCGTSGVDTARRLFGAMTERDVVSWNSMISCLIKVGEMGEAVRLFEQMPERDIVSWNTILAGYIKAGELNAAFELFEKMPERNSVSWSTMVSGYSKAGFMNMARMLFDKMPVKNLKGLAKEAISLYDKMEQARLQPNSGTYASILAACAESGLLAFGQRIHLSVQRSRLRHDTEVCNALVDMYAKCGNLDKAMDIFDGMVKRDVISWNTMLHGLALHGHGEAALELFSRMRLEGVTPDGVTFIALLCACRDVGLVKDGRHYFSIMKKYYGIVPQVEHYGCIVDLLGRGGFLKEAYELIKSMPMEPNAIIWGTLLEACRIHNDVGIAEEAVNQLVKLELSDANAFELLSNLYAVAGRWDDTKVKLQMNGTHT
ncbi:hypothetical protein AQUCO_00200744v1 [Aquilegia coerulea]|uniref:Pentacotripeptide-repeat region of PRORP domain-containing protein n=1 Tax=Aquilegia coerulea TaxID=218851 RepID=A0A2G5F4K2_AQUCA|nr:hypothetical protein AQUCO_00200744v1 [Aquilegia coerulea]